MAMNSNLFCDTESFADSFTDESEHRFEDSDFSSLFNENSSLCEQFRVYNCDVDDCNKNFRTKKSFLDHQRIHNGNKPFSW